MFHSFARIPVKRNQTGSTGCWVTVHDNRKTHDRAGIVPGVADFEAVTEQTETNVTDAVERDGQRQPFLILVLRQFDEAHCARRGVSGWFAALRG
jgi:hypothetical protein